MPDKPFHIGIDKSRAMIRIMFAEVFWDADIKRSFVEDVIDAILALGCEPGRQVTLVDLRNAILQSQEVVSTMQKLLADPNGGRVALVASSPLARMQTKRLQVRDGVRLFDDPEAAEAWLSGAAEDKAAA